MEPESAVSLVSVNAERVPPHACHTSTYRLQLHAGFTLRDAARLVPYLKRLGVEAVYLSPVTTASPGSRHGYDVCDPTRLNPELGTEDDLRALATALKAASMACVFDIVPNHMSADPVNNPWWRDVLRHGPSSAHADFFDIDWRPRKQGLHGKVLLPVLEDAYGVALEKGELKLEENAEGLVLRYRDVTYPLLPGILLDAYLPHDGRNVYETVALLNETATGEGREALHELLERQPYRLANWRTALHEANYRRFFDVSALLGIRVERPEVFEAVHGLVRELTSRLARHGVATGIRVDHIDGLKDPDEYLRRLTELLEESTGRPPYLVVEKILQDGEELSPAWPVAGTTGYDFLGDLERLFTAPRGLEALRAFQRRFDPAATPDDAQHDPEGDASRELIVTCKRTALSLLLRSELNALADMLDRLSETHRNFRDFTRDDIRRLLAETIACLRVYRTYGREGRFDDTDRRALDEALGEALHRLPDLPPALADFLKTIFLAFDPSHDVSPLSRAACREFAARLQQVMGAAHAKGVEDTAFYRDAGLLSLNEVGLWPGCTPLGVEEFHDRMRRRAARFPRAMLATSTHDTKRGEDVRARLAVLAEMPQDCEHAVTTLCHDPRVRGCPLLAEHPGETRVSAHDDYMLLQTLVGCWPLGPDGAPAPVDDAFIERIQGAILKAAREAKLHTNWIHPDEAYEAALHARVEQLLRGEGLPAVREHLFPFLTLCARRGMQASLARLACKCAAPGIPDFYQGTEGWDLSLVDPDNRREVDFETNRARLEALAPLLAALDDPEADRETRRAGIRDLMNRAPDGDIKRFVTARCLGWRAAHASLFLEGQYTPVSCLSGGATGKPHPDHVAFTRDHEGQSLLVVFPVRTARTTDAEAAAEPVVAVLPPEWRGATVRHLFTGSTIPLPSGEASGKSFPTLDVTALLREFPVAWLWKE